MSTNDKLPAENSQSSLTTDQMRTMTFVGVAAICLIITGVVEWVRRPEAIEEFGRVGQEFFPEFTDPTVATSLEVNAFDVESARPLEFQVRQLPNGRWVIPTHHDYPADAEEQLAKTAASIIGIKRGALVTRWPTDHAQYGVVNPRQNSLNVEDVEGVGKRITLRGDDKAILADYIIGKKTDEGANQHYVRYPEEDEVYIADLEIDLSTKFSDWVNTDLLELDAFDVRHISINDYKFNELRNQITSSVITTLDRKASGDPWVMDGLNEETEQVNETAIRETVNAIGDLKLVGVRPKQKGLTPDLRLDRAALASQNDLNILQSDLLTRGFILQPGENEDQANLRLLAREGELYAGTEKGLRYSLYFGRAFAGSQEELEIGGFSTDDEDADSDESKEGDDEKKGDAGDPDAKEEAKEAVDSENGNPGRYVFVRVEFDKKYLGDEPVKPVEPEEPAELNAAAEAEGEAAKEEVKEEAKKDAATEDGESEEAKPDPLVVMRQEYEDAKRQYEMDLREYESNLEEYNQKIEDGKKLADDLNRRFAEWYYVIPGDSFDKLRLTRANLVEPKEEETEEGDAGGNAKFDPSAPPFKLPPGLMPSGGTGDAGAGTEAADESTEPAKEGAESAKEATEPAKKEATEAAKEDAEPAKESTEPAKKESTEPAKEDAGTSSTEPAKKQ